MVDRRIVVALKKCLHIRKDDSVLIVTDTIKRGLAKRFELAARALSNKVKTITMKPTGQHGMEPPSNVAKEMMKHDVIIAVTRWSITHTNARKAARKKGARIASLPNFTENMIDALGIDYNRLESTSNRLAKLLMKGKRAHITTPYGTNVKFYLNKHVFMETPKEGFFNMPLGEVCVAPSKMHGILVFNSYQDLIKKPTKMIINNNRITDFESSHNGRIIKKILSADSKARYAAEFGIGTNYKAKIIYNILQDEKVIGTCHIAFGTNINFHGRNKSKVHIDLMLLKPTIKIDGKIIMEKGRPLW